MEDQVAPTAQGLLLCLNALAEEAATLAMTNTVAAIRRAIAACARENPLRAPSPDALADFMTVH